MRLFVFLALATTLAAAGSACRAPAPEAPDGGGDADSVAPPADGLAELWEDQWTEPAQDGRPQPDAEVGAPPTPIEIPAQELPDGRVQLPFLHQLLAIGGAPDPVFELVAGELPPGLALATDGTLSGNPEEAGDYLFTVAVDDGWTTASGTLTIHVPEVLLLSGFGPFVGYPVNPSIEALRSFHLKMIGGLDVRVVELPVTWNGSWPPLAQALSALQPVAAVATGVANTCAMRFETRAVNKKIGTDNDGVKFMGTPILDGGPAELAPLLPVDLMADAMEADGYPVTISTDAGTYLCNFIFYNVVDFALSTPPLVAGFIHVPPAPCVDYEIIDISRAHRVGLEALADWLAAGRPELPPPTRPRTATPPSYTPPSR